MKFLLVLLVLVAAAVFTLNIKKAATILCRIASGFAFLLVYNSIAPHIGLPPVGINIISSMVCGTLGFAGGVLLMCLNL